MSYLIAGLHSTSFRGLYTLILFDSDTSRWITEDVSVDLPPLREQIGHAEKVITIGGKAGSMGWVDLAQGILICDLLHKKHALRYVPLPELKVHDELKRVYASSCQDILATQGRIRYVKLRFQSQTRCGDISQDCNYVVNKAATWSTMADNSWKWNNDFTVDDTSIPIDNQNHSELLPYRQDNEATKLSLKGLCLGAPALSLKDDNLLYIMAKVDFMDRSAASVLAIDMEEKTLQGVAEFDGERTAGLNFIYLQSNISKYLDTKNPSRPD